MRVISRKILRDYCQSHSSACDALFNWYRVASKAQWQNLAEVQTTYKTAEAVGNFTVFNIKGNRYRLVVDIIYEHQRIYLSSKRRPSRESDGMNLGLALAIYKDSLFVVKSYHETA